MKTLLSLLTFAALLLQCSPKPTTITDDEKADIKRSVETVIDEIVASCKAGDADRLLATGDSTNTDYYYGTGVGAALTLPQFTNVINSALGNTTQEMNFPDRHVSVLDKDNAVAIMWGTVKHIPKGEGLAYTIPTCYTIVFQKRNEAWKVFHAHQSMDVIKRVVDSTGVQ